MKDDWEYVKIKGNKKIIQKKVNGKLKVVRTENMYKPISILGWSGK